MVSDEMWDDARIVGYLDRMAKGYPHGVAARFLQVIAAKSPMHGSAEEPARVAQQREFADGGSGTLEKNRADCRVLFVLLSESGALPPAEEALLNSIIEKGLRIARREVEVVVCRHVGEISEAVDRGVAAHTPRLVIVMSGESTVGAERRIAGSTVLATATLSGVASSLDRKREFWGQLQAAMRVV